MTTMTLWYVSKPRSSLTATGKDHLVRAGDDKTLCGRVPPWAPKPLPANYTPQRWAKAYEPWACQRCVKKLVSIPEGE